MYSIQLNDAASIGKTFHHSPYGTSASFPNCERQRPGPFGGVEDYDFNYITLAQRIKTYTEQVAGSEVTNGIRNEIERAEQVVFLGFAYHTQNMLLLRPFEELGSPDDLRNGGRHVRFRCFACKGRVAELVSARSQLAQ